MRFVEIEVSSEGEIGNLELNLVLSSKDNSEVNLYFFLFGE